ncbi:hypothetical protein [Undibacterium arcticum]|uniref:hypothetical protein n=1 Tax=Undibacterium arcticum TaxID=1762892 RepID=UPI0036F2136E
MKPPDGMEQHRLRMTRNDDELHDLEGQMRKQQLRIAKGGAVVLVRSAAAGGVPMARAMMATGLN